MYNCFVLPTSCACYCRLFPFAALASECIGQSAFRATIYCRALSPGLSVFGMVLCFGAGYVVLFSNIENAQNRELDPPVLGEYILLYYLKHW